MPEEVRRAADLLERRWAMTILYAANAGAVRFNELRQAIGGISPRMLTERLDELERAGLVERQIIDSRPPYFEYRLTADGRRLAKIVEALQAWSRGRAAVVAG